MRDPNDFKYPFRRAKPATEMKRRDYEKLDRGTTGAGAADIKEDVPGTFRAREKAIADVQKPVHGFRPERWLLARISRHASPTKVARELIDRLRRAPSEKRLRATRDGLQEFGRRRGGGRFIRKLVTQELVDEFQAKED